MKNVLHPPPEYWLKEVMPQNVLLLIVFLPLSELLAEEKYEFLT